VRGPSNRGLAEEAPFAYRDVERVVFVVEQARLAKPVAQLQCRSPCLREASSCERLGVSTGFA